MPRADKKAEVARARAVHDEIGEEKKQEQTETETTKQNLPQKKLRKEKQKQNLSSTPASENSLVDAGLEQKAGAADRAGLFRCSFSFLRDYMAAFVLCRHCSSCLSSIVIRSVIHPTASDYPVVQS